MKLGSMWAGAVLAMLPAVTAAQVVSTESGKVAGSTSDGVSSSAPCSVACGT